MTVAEPPREPLLRVERLGFRWPGGVLALRGVSFELAGGEVAGLLGPNGSGKSTLVRLIATALSPDSGTISRFPGQEGLDLRRVRRRMAASFDRTTALESLSGRENLEWLLRLRGFGRAAAGAIAARWLDRFGFGEERERAVAGYSLGMHRRLALAEAFASGASLLLLDEPLIGLDPSAREMLYSELREHTRSGGSALLALHDGRFAAAVCDRVFFLHRGAIVAAGRPADLVRQLGGQTLFRVETSAPVPALGSPPSALRLVGRSDRELRFSSAAGSAALAPLCAWLTASDVAVREIRVQEPGLDDLFLALTGESLQADLRSERDGSG